MKISANDERLLHRFRDGELSAEAAAACRVRLQAEPALRAALQAIADRALGFAAAPTVSAPAGFTAGVLAAVRRLPERAALEAAAAGAGVLVLCRRLLIAAAVLFGIGLLWQTGLLSGRSNDALQAAPDVVDREMQRLDRVIESWSPTGRPATGGAPGERR